MLKCEFHCHTKYSKDSLTSPKRIIETCIKKGIDRIAITDHDTIQGALATYQIDPYRVIIGEEITTNKGELLAFFVKDQIPAGLSPFQTIKRLQAQDAFISVAHPFDKMRKHWEENVLHDMVNDIDAIEVFNARCMTPNANQLAYEFAKKHDLPGTVGSDAHIPFEIGRAYMNLPQFTNKTELCAALNSSTPFTTPSGFWVHLFSRYAKLLKLFKNP